MLHVWKKCWVKKNGGYDIVCTPGTQFLTSIFEGQPSQNKAQTPIKPRGPIWVPGRSIFQADGAFGMQQNTTSPTVVGKKNMISHRPAWISGNLKMALPFLRGGYQISNQCRYIL